MDKAAEPASERDRDDGNLDSLAVPTSRYYLFFALAILGCALDLLTKAWVFAWRGMPRADGEYWIIEGFFGIETSLNRGALFGLGQGQVAVFAVLSVVAALGILYWLFIRKAAIDLWLTVALGLVMAGILGNLYDRLGLWAPADMSSEQACAVRDWILFRFRGWTWPNFNIADSFLVCGAILLVIEGFRHDTESKPDADRV